MQSASDDEYAFACLACSRVKAEEIERYSAELKAAGAFPSSREAMDQFMIEVERRVRIRVMREKSGSS